MLVVVYLFWFPFKTERFVCVEIYERRQLGLTPLNRLVTSADRFGAAKQSLVSRSLEPEISRPAQCKPIFRLDRCGQESHHAYLVPEIRLRAERQVETRQAVLPITARWTLNY